MRHRKRGRRLGRSSSHRQAMLRNLTISLFLTEREDDWYDGTDPTLPKKPKEKGRVITTIQKAKEVRPLVEKCITIARRSLSAQEEAQQYGTHADRGSQEYLAWRSSEDWKKWQAARAPALAARRRVLQLLGNRGKSVKLVGLPAAKEAVAILFDHIAPRFKDRPGGYTRVLRLAKPRLGDAGEQAILQFVGKYDRVSRKSEKPSFEDEAPESQAPADDTSAEETASEESAVATETEDPASENTAAENAQD